MPNPQLVEFINNSYLSGISKDILVKKISDAGWKTEDIELAFANSKYNQIASVELSTDISNSPTISGQQISNSPSNTISENVLSSQDLPVHNSQKKLLPLILVVIAIFVLISGVGYYAITELGFGQKELSNKQNQNDINTVSDKEHYDNLLVAFLETRQDSNSPTKLERDDLLKLPVDLVVYDLNEKARRSPIQIPPAKYADLELGQWSPDGKYLPIRGGYIDDPFSADLYIYDAINHEIKLLFEYDYEKSDDNGLLLESHTIVETDWLDNETIVLGKLDRDITKVVTVNVDGVSKNRQLSASERIYYISDNFNTLVSEYRFSDETTWEIAETTLNGRLVELPPKTTPKGYHQQSVYFSYQVDDFQNLLTDKEFERKFSEIESMDLPENEKEVLIKKLMNESLNSKYRLGRHDSANSILSEVELSKDGWFVKTMAQRPQSSIFYIYQSDGAIMGDTFRLIQFDANNGDSEVIYTQDYDFRINEFLSLSEMSSSRPVLLFTYDGEWMIDTVVAGLDEDYNNIEPFYVQNVVTNEKIELCEKWCSNIRTYNPYLLTASVYKK